MKIPFAPFWRRNLAFFRLAVVSNLEYRLNYFTDALLQPTLGALIELTLWFAVFAAASSSLIGGFPREYYLAYAICSPFIARITSNWMYEFRMIEEIESGSINGLLVRPLSFFEYYLSQLLGYKIITTAISIFVPIGIIAVMGLPFHFDRLPLALLLVTYYLIFLYLMSFIVSTIAFHLNKIHSLTVAKNLALWLLSGELVPLDLIPDPLKTVLLNLPFANAVYIPVAYLTGRVSRDVLLHGFVTTSIGILVLGSIAWYAWRQGLRKYVGTGA